MRCLSGKEILAGESAESLGAERIEKSSAGRRRRKLILGVNHDLNVAGIGFKMRKGEYRKNRTRL